MAREVIRRTSAEVAHLTVLARGSALRSLLAAAMTRVNTRVRRDALLIVAGTCARISIEATAGVTGRVVTVKTVARVVLNLACADRIEAVRVTHEASDAKPSAVATRRHARARGSAQ
jgi:hypothetical protein